MKFTVKNKTGENIIILMRDAGYHFIKKDENTGELGFVCPPKGYPRFHIHLKGNEQTGGVSLTLHLDQKKPIYKAAPAHSADYESEVLEKEAERIKQLFKT